jgi:uncharacterized protein YneF (UPF0154 family)
MYNLDMVKKLNRMNLTWTISVIVALIIGFVVGVYVANKPIDSGAYCPPQTCGHP